MSSRYSAAVIGCGRIGLDWERPDHPQPKPATHAGAFARNPAVQLVAIADPKPEVLKTARALFPGAAAFSDYHELLARAQPRIVAVATPDEMHAEVVLAAAAAGASAIVCEKPMTRHAADARRMIDACARAGALLFVNHTRRFDTEIRRARDAVVAGDIGEVQQATAYYTNGLFNTATHVVDLLRFFLGEARWVTAAENTRGASPDGDLGVDALVEFTSGARAALQYLDVRDYSVFDVRLWGRRGALGLTRFGYEVERTPLKRRDDVAGLFEIDREAVQREGVPRSFMAGLVAHVVECLEGRDRPVSRGEDGLAALELLHALRDSAIRGGARVFIPTSRSGERV